MGAEELVEEIAERLAQPEQTGPTYLSVAPPTNHAMRRRAKLAKRRRERTFNRWWMRMLRLGINPEDVLAERKRKAIERVRNAARPVGQDSGDADSAA